MTFDHQRYQMDLKIDPVSYNSAFFGQVSVNCGNYRNRSEGTIFLPSALLVVTALQVDVQIFSSALNKRHNLF